MADTFCSILPHPGADLDRKVHAMGPQPYLTHRFMPPAPGAGRSPCPALNALSNHGYLPRDGRSISVIHIAREFKTIYNISTPLALLTTLVGYFLCGHGFFLLDLRDVALHNCIEHDGSFVRMDAVPGERLAPTAIDKARLRSVVQCTSTPSGLTLRDLAHARLLRDKETSRPLNPFHYFLALGAVALIWLLLKNESDVVPVKDLEVWLGSDRLPDRWRRQRNSIGIIQTSITAYRISQYIREINDKHQ